MANHVPRLLPYLISTRLRNDLTDSPVPLAAAKAKWMSSGTGLDRMLLVEPLQLSRREIASKFTLPGHETSVQEFKLFIALRKNPVTGALS